MFTVLAEAGLNVYVADPTAVPNADPSVLVCTDSVWVRVAQAVDGGSFSVTLPTLYVAPRSTCSHCGKAPFALSQYVFASPSVAVAAACVALTALLAVAGRPAAMLVVLPIPLPDRATVVGLLLALLVMVTAPARDPAAVGVNRTVTVQDAPTASVAQLLVWLKSPDAATPETVAEVVPVLVTVTVWVGAEAPTTVPAKDRLDGFGLTIGPGATPVPDSGTELVIPAAVTVSVPVREPLAAGRNVTLTVHDAPAAMLLPQLFVWVKSPVIATEVTGAAALPLFVTVTACAALAPPVATVPKPTAVGLIEISEPLSGRYGGNAGFVMLLHAVGDVMPELPPPSVSVKPTPQL
jgi:hypothetical protein